MYNVQAKALLAHNSLLCQYPEDWPWVEDMIRTAIARFPAQLIKTGQYNCISSTICSFCIYVFPSVSIKPRNKEASSYFAVVLFGSFHSPPLFRQLIHRQSLSISLCLSTLYTRGGVGDRGGGPK